MFCFDRYDFLEVHFLFKKSRGFANIEVGFKLYSWTDFAKWNSI